MRHKLSALSKGDYEQIILRNEQFVYKRCYQDHAVFIACNLNEAPYEASWHVTGDILMDAMHEHTLYSVENQTVHVTIPPKQSLILVSMERDKHKERDMIDQCSVDTSMLRRTIPAPGRYRHFKGKEYEVISIAKHSETLEEYVVYRQLYGDQSIWVRPLSMFCETIEINGHEQPRFTYINQI